MSTKTTYIQTELGLIPEDWEVKKLGEVIKLGNGKDYKHLNSGNIPVYGTGGIITYVDKYLFNGKSVGIGRKGSIDKPVLLDGKFWTVDTLFYVKEFFNSDIDFIYNSFLKIPWLKYNEATGLPSLSQNIINNLKIPLPPLPEQKKIADCLSTWDCAIEKQSQLINALTQRKKALMQQLLTGKKRLPGFSDEWKEVKLGEIAKTFSGGTPKSTIKEYYIGNIPFIKSGEINSTQTEQFINEEGIKNSSAKKVNKGDLLYALYGATSGTVGISNIDGAINQAVLCIRTKENKFYLFYLLDYLKQNIINSFLQGGQGNLSSKIINELNINIPTISEQTAIAAILATADRELQLQKEKLAQLQIQKKGLMQVLLTGKKRLLN